MNPGGCKSGSSTPSSVSDAISMETDALLEIATRKQVALKTLACRKINLCSLMC